MEYVDGIPVGDADRLVANGYDLEEIGSKMLDNYATQILDHGFFHADPHPGNVIIRDGRIVYIDLGNMVPPVGTRPRRVWRHHRGRGAKEPGALKDALMRFAAKKDNAAIDHARFLADLDLLLEDYGSCDVAEIDVGLVLERHHAAHAIICNVMLPASVTSVSRGIVTIEGTVAPYIPNQNIVAIINAHIKGKKGTREEIRDALEDLARAIYSSGRGTLDAASYSGEALKMLTRGQLKMNMEVPRLRGAACASFAHDQPRGDCDGDRGSVRGLEPDGGNREWTRASSACRCCRSSGISVRSFCDLAHLQHLAQEIAPAVWISRADARGRRNKAA